MEKFVNLLKNPIFITVMIIVAGVGGIFGLVRLFPDSQSNSLTQTNKFWGKADSSVVVTEYADFQCPGCSSFFSNDEQALKAAYVDKIKFEYKYFPLTSLHRNAQKAAEAAEAASVQGKFWEYHDILYTRQTAESTEWNIAKYVDYAKELGLDTTKFRKELDENTYRQVVKDGANEAQKKGYSRTPTIEINGKKFEGANGNVPTFAELQAEIDRLLAAEPTTTPTTEPQNGN